jgi:hypothetical protein
MIAVGEPVYRHPAQYTEVHDFLHRLEYLFLVTSFD